VEDYYLKNFEIPREGFFVECGAGNGLIQPNTAFLERKLGWSGILIESHDLLFSELEKNRATGRVQCVHATVGVHDKEVIFDEIHYDGTPHSECLGCSSIVDVKTKFARKKKCKSITSVLREASAPSVIDYCVIDVEYAAADVIHTLDLDAFLIRFLAVELKPEDRYCQAVNYILSKGYLLKRILPIGPDYLFVKA